MRKFESQVQLIKYKVLKEIIERAAKGEFITTRHKIPKAVLPGDKPITRCCVYKEREIVSERVDVAADPITAEDPIIEIIELACDECPIERFRVTEACRGCLAHRCIQACPRNAILVVQGKAFIDQEKCVECGRCSEACSYNAISDVMRPCKKACKSKAIEIQENKKVSINRLKCTSCGACVYQCPFGAVNDRSEVIPVVKALEASKVSGAKNVYAVIAPAISTQYNGNMGQVVNAIKKIGFKDVVEAALGADIVAYNEGLEFVERVGKNGEACMMTSCCPAFVEHVKKSFGDLSIHISTMVSPMIAVSRFIRKTDPNSVIVFIGPCTAKKEEARQKDISDAVDYVMTFEELEAMIDAYGIVVDECEDVALDNASHFGRVFARSGGVKEAVEEVLREEGIDNISFNPISCSGIDEIDKALRMLKGGRNTFNFIEGMACPGGCIGGAASLTHEPKDQKLVDKYASLAIERNVKDAIRALDLEGIKLHRH
ncbi:MAG: 4Fe-4S dicluster protein [Clostridiales bacterium]|jgi:[FeFe] hydrogenase (group B1/B3)|nr:4Fe-4S dicluster protein [Clostridiales bacterium]